MATTAVPQGSFLRPIIQFFIIDVINVDAGVCIVKTTRFIESEVTKICNVNL